MTITKSQDKIFKDNELCMKHTFAAIPKIIKFTSAKNVTF